MLDQFTRNIYRNTPRAFAGDARALALATRLVDTARDLALAPVERWFVYMPFEHSERLVDQYESVRLFERLAADGLERAAGLGAPALRRGRAVRPLPSPQCDPRAGVDAGRGRVPEAAGFRVLSRRVR